MRDGKRWFDPSDSVDTGEEYALVVNTDGNLLNPPSPGWKMGRMGKAEAKSRFCGEISVNRIMRNNFRE